MYRPLLAARDAAVATGANVVGWKVAWNHPSAQAAMGVDGPGVGFVFDTTLLPVGKPVSLDGTTFPGVETEVALRIGPDGGIDAVAPAAEVIDVSTPADDAAAALGANAWHWAAVVGDWQRPPDGLGLLDVDWLAATVASFGERLAPGHVVLSGSLAPMPQWVKPGDRVDIVVPGLGGFTVEFSKGES